MLSGAARGGSGVKKVHKRLPAGRGRAAGAAAAFTKQAPGRLSRGDEW